MTTKTKLLANAAVVAPVAPKPGDTVRNLLSEISVTAATAGMARDVLIAKLREFANSPNKAQLRQLQGAVMQGYVAGRLARIAGRASADPSDMGAAAILLAKAGATAERANSAGIRTVDEERIANSARQFWHQTSVKADAAPNAGTGTGRAVGGKASAKKRAATKSIGAVDVTIGAPAKAAGSKAKGLPALSSVSTGRGDATAHVMGVAATLMAYVEEKTNARHLGAAACKIIRAACRSMTQLPMPK